MRKTVGQVEQDVGERVGEGVGHADFAAQRAHGDQSTYHGEFAYVVADLIKQGAEVGGEAAGAGQFAVQEVENERGDEQYERQAWEGNDQGRDDEAKWNLTEGERAGVDAGKREGLDDGSDEIAAQPA